MAKERRLQDAHGRFVCALTKNEAWSMLSRGTIVKVGKTTYRLNTPPEPSRSEPSSPCLTGGARHKGDGGDMHAIAGTAFKGHRLSEAQRERFIGHSVMTARKVSNVKFPATTTVRVLFVGDAAEEEEALHAYEHDGRYEHSESSFHT